MCHIWLYVFIQEERKITPPKLENLRRGLLFHLIHKNIYVSAS